MDIRIYWSNCTNLLEPHQAAFYLITGELPEAVILAGTSQEIRDRYHAGTRDEQRSWRQETGAITVADGHAREVNMPSGRMVWTDRRETAVDIYRSVRGGQLTLKLSVGGQSRTIDTAESFLKAQRTALNLAVLAEVAHKEAQIKETVSGT